jgi:hypothetical protein
MSKFIDQELAASVSVVSSSEATIAMIAITYPDGVTHTWTGTAKRDPEDKFNAEVGTKLALSRAFRSAASQLDRQANGLVKNIEDNLRQREQQMRRPRKGMVFPVARRSRRAAKEARA